MSEQRARNYALITYHSEEVIKSVLSEYASRIRNFAFIMHDKDTKEDGSLQEVHFHVLLQLTNAMTLSAVRKMFPVGQNTLGQIVRDKADCFDYLDHAGCPEKYHYDHSLIVSNDLAYWEGLQSGEADDKTLSLLDDILEGVSPRELVRRYGRDVALNFYKYREFAKMMRRLETPVPEKLPEGMTVVEMPKLKTSCQIKMDDVIFDAPEGRVIIDKDTGEMKDNF